MDALIVTRIAVGYCGWPLVLVLEEWWRCRAQGRGRIRDMRSFLSYVLSYS